MSVALWIVNVLLALAFLVSGGVKAIRSRETLLDAGMGWVEDYSATALRTIGVLEVIGAAGLVLPLATDIGPILAPLAAVGLTVMMAAAIRVHIRRGEGFTPALILGVASIASAILGFANL